MAYPIPNGGVVEIVANQRLAGQVILNIFHYKAEGTVTDAKPELIELLDVVNSAGGNSIAEKMAQAQGLGLTYDSWTVQLISPTRYLKMAKAPAYAGAEGEGTSMPPNVAAVLTKKAEVSGRHGIGNMHLGGVPKEQAVNGSWTAEYMLLLQALAATLPESITTTTITWRPVLIQRAQISSSVRFVEVQPQKTTRIMRRRTVGLGI